MKPEMKAEVLDFIKGQFKDMETNVTADELNPVKEYMVKAFTENKEKNRPWLNGMSHEISTGTDTFNGNIESMNSITTQDVMDFMKALNAQDNYRIIILAPESK